MTANVGLGLAPFGTSLLGFGTPATEDPRGGAVLRDEVTGEVQNARRIDAVSKRYVYDANGRILGMGGVRQRVQLALSTDAGTSAVATLGHKLSAIRHVTASLEREARDTVAAALKHMTDTGEIAIEAVAISRIRTSTIGVLVRWRDLSTGLVFTDGVR